VELSSLGTARRQTGAGLLCKARERTPELNSFLSVKNSFKSNFIPKNVVSEIQNDLRAATSWKSKSTNTISSIAENSYWQTEYSLITIDQKNTLKIRLEECPTQNSLIILAEKSLNCQEGKTHLNRPNFETRILATQPRLRISGVALSLSRRMPGSFIKTRRDATDK
jgi:hypothetical protein